MTEHRFDAVGLGTILVDHLVALRENPEADTENAACPRTSPGCLSCGRMCQGESTP